MKSIIKNINGVRIEFRIKLQPRYRANQGERYWQKIINVTDGVGFAPAAKWADALEVARKFANEKNEWHINRRAQVALK